MTLMLHLNCRRVANGKKVGVVEGLVLMGRRLEILHSLLPGAVGYLLGSRYHLVDLRSGWSCSCHWCSHCYMTW